ncbi:histidine kinase [Lacrimispora sp.]|uniref:sensor histidine kinase n=1 Tax=Lacrimispora sp. TaxID=2719234 RepID=UPI0029E16CF1|nr:two-component system, sensor histidine kinase YesM [Lacrimispora sp.]
MKWFANLKFRYQLVTGMIFITSAALFLIGQLSYSYFYHRNTNEVLRRAGSSVHMAGDSLSSQFNSLSAATNHLLVKDPFPQMIADINNYKFTGYARYFTAATAVTDSFLQNHDLVNNVLVYGDDHIMFSPSSLGISRHFDQLLPEDIWQYPRITVLPTRYSSMFGKEGVIPISYPVSSILSSKHLAYQDIPNCRKVRFILLIDTDQIRDYFKRMSNRYTYCMYLADENGQPLDITKKEYPDAFLPQICNWIADGSPGQEGTVKAENEDLFLTMDRIKFSDLNVIHITKKSALTGDIKELRSFFILVWIACFLAAVLLSMALSGLLTRNLRVLGTIIRSINDKTYTKRREFNHTDEISLLGVQLNQMYDTIQLQLLQIKDEEQKKAMAEIQMMSEQINPHFLYNTLECIHFQILNGHSETAEGMLESLGKYLRTTLSFGKTLISIEKEVEHVTSYMEIMNRHSSDGILMETKIDPLLKDCKIMKILLQPLAENCIRHGFDGFISGFEPVPPRIDIVISSEENNRITIEVTDNGKGIDIEVANACITENSPESQKHFGLSNIQKRLKACYGDSFHISFISIPYLKNSVIIELPKDI